MKSRFQKNPIIKVGITSITIAGFLQGFLFAQNIQSCELAPAYNTNREIKKETTLYAGTDCNPKQDLAGYAGRSVYLLLGKKPDTFLWRIESAGSYVRLYGSIFDSALQFPFLSNHMPTSSTFSSDVLILKAQGGTFLKPTVDRNTIAGQIVSKNVYRRMIAGTVSCNYYYTNASDSTKKDVTLAAKMNTTTETATSCTNYYLAYCGDGIIDNSTTEKDGITVNGTLVKWAAGNVPAEVCDDGAQNGQAGKCKTDCSGNGTSGPVCGNNVVESPETCDEGNTLNGQPGHCNLTCNGTVPVGGNFTVAKTLVNDKSYTPGENLQFKISFTNGTSQTISNIKIEDYLPAGFAFVSSEITGATAPYYFSTGSEGGNIKISYTGFSLAANQQGYILITAKLLSCDKTLNNAFWYAGAVTGYVQKLVNCSSTPVNISKSVSKSSFLPGETAGFTITATNNTSSAITAISLQDIWPSNGCVYFTGNYSSNIAVQGAQNGNISTWTLASLGIGQTLTITFNGQIKPDSTCAGAYTNTATISYTDPSGTKQNSTTANFSVAQVTQSMSITKTVVQQGYGPSDMVVFEIVYKNNGLTPINGFKITDYWPDALEFKGANPWPKNETARPLVWDFSNQVLQPDASGKIRITGQIKTNIR